jgi:hypothetical protein
MVPKRMPDVRELEIAQARMTEREGSWFDTHDHLGNHAVCDRVWARLPNLKKLVVESGWDIFERIEHDAIEEIVIEDGVPFCTVRGHARPWRVPSLRSIAWHYRVDCTGTGAAATAEDFVPIWTADATALREVDLGSANLYARPNETPILDVPGFRAMLPRLEVLRLPRHALGRTPDAVESALQKHAADLAHLRELTLT